MKVKVTQFYPTLCNSMDHTVHGILQVRGLEWVAFPFSRGFFQPRDQIQVSAWQANTLPAKPQGKPKNTGMGSLSLLCKFRKKYFWSIVDLQCCISFRCTAKWISYIYIHIYPFFLTFFFPCTTFSSVQSLSCVRLFATPWIAAHQASQSFTNPRSSLRLTSIESVMSYSHLILCRPLLLLPQSLPASESFPVSQLFAWGGQSTGVSALASFLPKKSQGWPPSEWTGWISLQSLLQHHSSKASILRRSAFFTVQLSHPYVTTGKTVALTRWNFIGKVMSLLFYFFF